ncbi:hypothetical protein MBLNU459_g4853t2 [Dothideomycetes sp. NU459]
MSTATSMTQHVPASEAVMDSQKTDGTATTGKTPYHLVPSDTPHDNEKIALNPAAGASTSTLGATDPKTQDIKSWGEGFQRMQDERLEKQRYEMSSQKDDEVSLTALGAKVDRALGRRMVGQDATFTRRESQAYAVELPEKRSIEVEAAS